MMECSARRVMSKMFISTNLIILLSVTVIYANAIECPLELSLDITNGTYLENGVIISDGVWYESKVQFNHNGSVRACVCAIKPCIRKCCPREHAIVNKTCTPYDKKLLLEIHEGVNPITVSDDHFHYMYNLECPFGANKLEPFKYENEYFYVQRDGKLYIPHAADEMLSFEQYCMEFDTDDEVESISAFVCKGEAEQTNMDALYAYGTIVSTPFLLATFLVYAILPDQNLHGKFVMCFVISLFGSNLFIAIILQADYFEVLAIILHLFFNLTACFWMNAMSIDIWWTFRGLRGFSGTSKGTEQKRFLLYSGYAWGVPLLFILAYWFKGDISEMLYFDIPNAVLMIINVILFWSTTWNIRKVKQETARLKRNDSRKQMYQNDKQRFNLHLKLMLAMGINWSMEFAYSIVIWQVSYVSHIWYLNDFCNAVCGIFIFFMFVVKRNIWNLLKKRYYMLMRKPHLARSTVQPQRSQTPQENSSVNQ